MRSDKERVKEILDVMMRVAQGDYSVQMEVSDKNDIFDSLAMGLNMMIDDVRESVEIALQNERIQQMNEELRLAKEKAEKSDRLKSAFLANMSHEIRTPMNGILGFAELLKKPELTGEQQEKYIHIIQESGERMLNLINDLIEISKIESGYMGVTKSTANINDRIEFIHTFFKPEADKKGIRIFYDHHLSREYANIVTDHEKVNAILTNLVKNALKFTDEGFVEFGYEVENHVLKFFVKDTGMGISSVNIHEIFDRFVQADETISRSYDGAGLGLAISKAYVELLGGEIWAESRTGSGSQFYFTIPFEPESVPVSITTNTETCNPAAEQRKLKILITDDSPSAAMLLSILLEDMSSDILLANTGREAVDICKKHHDIDLILMDIKMPVMNGYEALHEIRSFNKEVRIIAETAHALAGEREKAILAGFNDYVTKPIKMDDLLKAIHRLFEK